MDVQITGTFVDPKYLPRRIGGELPDEECWSDGGRLTSAETAFLKRAEDDEGGWGGDAAEWRPTRRGGQRYYGGEWGPDGEST